jgi:hypothetical protein
MTSKQIIIPLKLYRIQVGYLDSRRERHFCFCFLLFREVAQVATLLRTHLYKPGAVSIVLLSDPAQFVKKVAGQQQRLQESISSFRAMKDRNPPRTRQSRVFDRESESFCLFSSVCSSVGP